MLIKKQMIFVQNQWLLTTKYDKIAETKLVFIIENKE